MRQRVRLQCCTRGRTRPAHPRQLAGVLMDDEPARRFLCARCSAPTLVCSHCDRGQVYCATGCAQLVRRQSQRESGRRYQGGLRGRFKHAARTRCWRERQALLTVLVARAEVASAQSAAQSAAQSVTHQGSPAPASDAVLSVLSPMPATATPALVSTAQPCTAITSSSASSPAASLPLTLPLRLPTWRCHWCHTPCVAQVRLDFLRRSRPARRASARVSHGHSP